MKRKFLIVLLAIISAVTCAFGLTACNLFENNSSGTNNEQGDSGNTGGGNNTEQGGNGEHKHLLTFVDAEDATCTNDGNTAYYICSGCEKWFADVDCKTEITDKSSVVIKAIHSLTAVEKHDATCTADGNIAYYTCSGCEKWFADVDCKTEIMDKSSVVISKTAEHNFKDKVCSVCGTHEPTEGLRYSLSDDLNYMCSGIGTATDTDIYIAKEYNGKPVISIGRNAFKDCGSIASVTIPDSVTYIDDYAFYNCYNMTSISISNSVTSIGDYALALCGKLTSIPIPNRVISIGDYAFQHCYMTSIIIPSSVTSIGGYAFYGCHSVTIYCEAESQPDGWNSNWNYMLSVNKTAIYCPVVWGYKSGL